MQSSRVRAASEASTSGRCVPASRQHQRMVPSNQRCHRIIRAALSEADDRSSDRTYQRASTIPDSLPVAESGADWREFRARLVASTKAGSVQEQQQQQQEPAALSVGAAAADRSAFNQLEWAHEVSRPEPGCLLLAHPYMFRDRQRYFYQAVILLLDNGPDGSYGIILNRPTQYKVSQIKSTVHELLALFKDNRLYMGGDCGDTAMVVLTPRSDIQGVTEVTQGIYHHNVHGAGAAVASGIAEPEDFRFFAQYAGWAPGQLEEECKSGVWFCTAASPSLTLNQELSNGGAMWHTILQVMGGDHARVSDIVSEVEQRDLREATARLQQAAAGGSTSPAHMGLSSSSSDGDDSSSDMEDCTSCYVDEQYLSSADDAGQQQHGDPRWHQ